MNLGCAPSLRGGRRECCHSATMAPYDVVKYCLDTAWKEAMLLQQKHISKEKIPVITQFAIGALNRNVIISAFSKTGIYPFSQQTITEDLLVGDQTKHVKTSNISNTQYSHFDNVARPSLVLQVYNENDNKIGGVIDININNSKFTQTDPIKSLLFRMHQQ